jgi:hypothetical protein
VTRVKFFDKVMSEAICFPGFPQIIVTRGYVYSYLTKLGWDQSERGYGSLDYTVFASPVVAATLTAPEIREHYLNLPEIVNTFSRHSEDNLINDR